MTDETILPLYLRGRFAPVPEEHSAADLTVRGCLPPDLDGRYLRNGPNPLPGQDEGALGHRSRHAPGHPAAQFTHKTYRGCCGQGTFR